MVSQVQTLKIIGIFFFLVCLFPLINAAEEELSYEPNTSMNLIVKCFDTDSALCSSSTTCFLDVFYPNMSNYLYMGAMTSNGSFYNYSVSPTPILGVYHASILCNDSLTSGYSTFDFYVGNPSTDPQIKITILGIAVLLGIASLFFAGFLFIKKDLYKWTFFILAVLFLVMTINVASISLRNEAGSENIRNIFDTIGAISYYMYWFCFGLIAIIWMFAIIMTIGNEWKMRRAKAIGQPMDFSKY